VRRSRPDLRHHQSPGRGAARRPCTVVRVQACADGADRRHVMVEDALSAVAHRGACPGTPPVILFFGDVLPAGAVIDRPAAPDAG